MTRHAELDRCRRQRLGISLGVHFRLHRAYDKFRMTENRKGFRLSSNEKWTPAIEVPLLALLHHLQLPYAVSGLIRFA